MARRRRAGPLAWVGFAVLLLMTVALAGIAVRQGFAAHTLVLLIFGAVLLVRVLVRLVGHRLRPLVLRRLLQLLVLLSAAALSVAVRTVLSRADTSTSPWVLVLVAAFSLVVSTTLLIVTGGGARRP